jgi:GH24 family phage-related lysozyme (muramidase)
VSNTIEIRGLSSDDANTEAQIFRDSGAAVSLRPSGGGLFILQAIFDDQQGSTPQPNAPAVEITDPPQVGGQSTSPLGGISLTPAAGQANSAGRNAQLNSDAPPNLGPGAGQSAPLVVSPPPATSAGGSQNRQVTSPGNLTLNEAGFALLKKWEGCILFAYDDANDHRVLPGQTIHGTLTIGYGHTGTDVVPGLNWTTDEAEEALHHDTDAVATQIGPLIRHTLNSNQFSAFVCFAFNIGVRGFGGSSALHLANAGNLQDVPAAIALWNKARVNGVAVVSSGLANRRNAEIKLWNSP